MHLAANGSMAWNAKVVAVSVLLGAGCSAAPSASLDAEKSGLDGGHHSSATIDTGHSFGNAGSFVVVAADGGSADSGAFDDFEDAGSLAEARPTPVGWIQVMSTCGYSFVAPPDLKEVPAQGLDSCISHYETATCVLRADYGAFSDGLISWADLPGGRLAKIEVDGREAVLALAGPIAESLQPYIAATNIPLPDVEDTVSLTFSAHCESKQELESAVQVFHTISIPVN
jgi:hypothetical protein